MEDLPFLSEILSRFKKRNENRRFLIALVGPPAAGKSHLASILPGIIDHALNASVTSTFAMDAYHMTNQALVAQGIHPHKGCHFTFDVKTFSEKLVEIKENPGEISCPIYNRSLGDPTPDAKTIGVSDKIILVEGNYLLLDIWPWNTLRYLFEYSIFIEVDQALQFQRLLKRHQASGKTIQEAEHKIHRTDFPNAELIRRYQHRADYVFRPESNF